MWRQLSSVISNVTHAQEKKNAIGFCCKCGNPITYGCKFCTTCGTPVLESILAEEKSGKRREHGQNRKRKAQKKQEGKAIPPKACNSR